MNSDAVLDAMHGALRRAEALAGVPELRRNETLDSALEAVAGGALAWANFVDGDLERMDTALSGDMAHELRQSALVEIVVKAATDPERRAALAVIADALNAEINADQTLGGQVSQWEIVALERDNLAETGVLNLKGATLTIAAEFLADSAI